MPTYEYRCLDCENRVEVFQTFKDEALTICEVCGGRLRKVIYPVGIQFKGSGFYSTDRRASQPVSRGSNSNNSKDKAESKSSESGTESKSDSKADSSAPAKSDAASAARKAERSA